MAVIPFSGLCRDHFVVLIDLSAYSVLVKGSANLLSF